MSESPNNEIVPDEPKRTFVEKLRTLANRIRPTQNVISTPGREPSAKDISRRAFLKGAGRAGILTAGAVVLSQIPGSEILNPSIAQTIIIDLAPDQPTPGIDQKEFIDTSNISDALKINGYPTLEDLLQAVPPEKSIDENYNLNTYFYNNFQTLKEKYGDKLYPSMLFTLMMDEKKGHGVEIANALKQSEAYYGKQITPILYPSQEAYQHVGFRSFTNQGDGWENHGLEITLNADAVIPLLQKAKEGSNSVHTVFNLSWQLGSQEVIFGGWGMDSSRIMTRWSNAEGSNGEPLFFVYPDQEFGPLDGEERVIDGKTYMVFPDIAKEIVTRNGTGDYYISIDGNLALVAKPRIEAEQIFDQLEGISEREMLNNPHIDPVVNVQVLEAYRSETVQKSIQEVIKVAQAFPNDFIVLAAGNIQDDLRNIPKLPDNVIIVGEWHDGSIKPTGLVYGVDDVPNSKLKLARGSSFSVPFVATTVKEMLTKGIPFSEIKQKLQTDLSTREPYRAREEGNPDSTLEQANVLNIEKLQEKMQFEF